MAAVNAAVFVTTSVSESPVLTTSSSLPKRSTYFCSLSSHNRNPGTTAEPVFAAIRAIPDAVHASTPKNGTNTPCGGVIFMNHPIAMQTPNAVHELIHQWIIQPANHHPHRHSHQRVIKTRQLPRSQVSGQHQHTLAALTSCHIVLEPLIANKP